jgi:hypothetical protein
MRYGRITRVGRLLRATGLDEVPQFINILNPDRRPASDATARQRTLKGI